MKAKDVLTELKRRFPNEPEYHQAVEEVLNTIEDTYNRNIEFEKSNLIERLCIPDRIFSFRVTWTDDQGNVHTNMGYRIQHNNAIGPYKGGIRFHSSVNLSILKFSSFITASCFAAITQSFHDKDKIYSLNQLAKEAGFSKTPFRDAVLRLEQERYIDILPSRGFTLHKMSKEDIIETYQMRNAIEIYCSKQLALHLDTPRGQEYFNKLSTKIELQKEIRNTTHSEEDFSRKDYEFHRSIVQYVDNESMLEIYRRFMYRIFWLTVTSFSQKGRMDETINEHISLLNMIQAQDLTALEKLIMHHLDVPQKITLSLIQ